MPRTPADILPRRANEKELAKVKAKLARGAGHYNVYPRYTGGSPAMVAEDVAERVAEEERIGFTHAMDGAYGEAEKNKATKLALRGVVERLVETPRGWLVYDYFEGQWYFRPFGIFHPEITRTTDGSGVQTFTVYSRQGLTLGRYFRAEDAIERAKIQSTEDFGYVVNR